MPPFDFSHPFDSAVGLAKSAAKTTQDTAEFIAKSGKQSDFNNSKIGAVLVFPHELDTENETTTMNYMVFHTEDLLRNGTSLYPVTIILPIPKTGLSDTSGGEWNDSTENSFLNNMNIGGGLVNAVNDNTGTMLPDAVMATVLGLYGNSNSGTGGGLLPDIVDFAGSRAKIAINPGVVNVFKKASTKKFKFDYDLVARNQQEAIAIKAICDSFKVGALPEKQTQGDKLSSFLKYPPLWNISMRYSKNGLFYIDTCRLDETVVKYGGDQYSEFETDRLGTPTVVSISVSFTQMRLPVASDISKDLRGMLESSKSANVKTIGAEATDNINRAVANYNRDQAPTLDATNVAGALVTTAVKAKLNGGNP